MKTKLLEVEPDTSFSVFHNNSVNLKSSNSYSARIRFSLQYRRSYGNKSYPCLFPDVYGKNTRVLIWVRSNASVIWGHQIVIDESLKYRILENISNEAFQALWAEIPFENEKNVICGILCRQHNSPERFQLYFAESVKKFTSSGKNDHQAKKIKAIVFAKCSLWVKN